MKADGLTKESLAVEYHLDMFTAEILFRLINLVHLFWIAETHGYNTIELNHLEIPLIDLIDGNGVFFVSYETLFQILFGISKNEDEGRFYAFSISLTSIEESGLISIGTENDDSGISLTEGGIDLCRRYLIKCCLQ